MSGEGAVVLRDAAQKRGSFRMQRASLAAKETSPAAKEIKSRAASPAPKIVSTLFPRKIGFDLD
jgi:hypothetical protein